MSRLGAMPDCTLSFLITCFTPNKLPTTIYELLPKQLLDIRRYAPELLQLNILLDITPVILPLLLHPYCTDQQILIGMLRRHELDHVRPVAHDAQRQRTKRVREYIGHALLQNAVPQYRAERLPRSKLRVQ